MSNDENNTDPETATSPGIDALDSILAKESAKASDEREKIAQSIKDQENQRLLDEKNALEDRRNALLLERQEAIRRRQSQIQGNSESGGQAAPIDAETQRMIPGSGPDLNQPKRMGLYLMILLLAGGGAAFGLKSSGTDGGPLEALTGNQAILTQEPTQNVAPIVTKDTSSSDKGTDSDVQMATTDSGRSADGVTSEKSKDTKTKVAPKVKTRPKVVKKRPHRKPTKAKAKPKGSGIIKLRQGLGGR